MRRSSLTSLRDVVTITATAPALTWNKSWLTHAIVLVVIAFGPSVLCPVCWASDLLAYLVIFCLVVYLMCIIFSAHRVSSLTIQRLEIAEEDTRLVERMLQIKLRKPNIGNICLRLPTLRQRNYIITMANFEAFNITQTKTN